MKTLKDQINEFHFTLGENTTEYDGQSIVDFMSACAREIAVTSPWADVSRITGASDHTRRVIECHGNPVDLFTYASADHLVPVKLKENRAHWRRRVSIGAWNKIRGGSALEMLTTSLEADGPDPVPDRVYASLLDRVFGMCSIYMGYQTLAVREQMVKRLMESGPRIRLRADQDKRMSTAERARLKRRADCEAKLKTAQNSVGWQIRSMSKIGQDFFGNLTFYLDLIEKSINTGLDDSCEDLKELKVKLHAVNELMLDLDERSQRFHARLDRLTGMDEEMDVESAHQEDES